MRFHFGFSTDVGRKRNQNQDRGITLPDLGLFMVADGMGGHKGGEIASGMAVEAVPNHIRKMQKNVKWDPKQSLKESLEVACKEIFNKSCKEATLQGMGTTSVALLFHDDTLHVGHVGDSRCYYFKPGAVWQVTRDHSLVQEKLKAGLITREQLKTDKMKNVITRSVGVEEHVDVELYEMGVTQGDIFLICSDGLSGLVDDNEMLEVVNENWFKNRNLQETADKLTERANQNGGDDNITTVLIEVA